MSLTLQKRYRSLSSVVMSLEFGRGSSGRTPVVRYLRQPSRCAHVVGLSPPTDLRRISKRSAHERAHFQPKRRDRPANTDRKPSRTRPHLHGHNAPQGPCDPSWTLTGPITLPPFRIVTAIDDPCMRPDRCAGRVVTCGPRLIVHVPSASK